MAAGIKIIATVMSFLIVSISEVAPWFSSENIKNEVNSALEAISLESVFGFVSERYAVDEETIASYEELVSSFRDSAEKFMNEEAVRKIIITDDEMLWPVGHKSEVVSGFPYYSNGGVHHGIDIFVTGLDGRNRDENGDSLSYGKPFRAAQSGVVVNVCNDNKWNTGFGNYCLIDHGDGTQTLYAHARTIDVSEGDTVSLGQTIGEIGDTGNTTAPHLHFEVRITDDGSCRRVDPMDYVSEPTV